MKCEVLPGLVRYLHNLMNMNSLDLKDILYDEPFVKKELQSTHGLDLYFQARAVAVFSEFIQPCTVDNVEVYGSMHLSDALPHVLYMSNTMLISVADPTVEYIWDTEVRILKFTYFKEFHVDVDYKLPIIPAGHVLLLHEGVVLHNPLICQASAYIILQGNATIDVSQLDIDMPAIVCDGRVGISSYSKHKLRLCTKQGIPTIGKSVAGTSHYAEVECVDYVARMPWLANVDLEQETALGA